MEVGKNVLGSPVRETVPSELVPADVFSSETMELGGDVGLEVGCEVSCEVGGDVAGDVGGEVGSEVGGEVG